jgi:hypothetical protein
MPAPFQDSEGVGLVRLEAVSMLACCDAPVSKRHFPSIDRFVSYDETADWSMERLRPGYGLLGLVVWGVLHIARLTS